MKPVVSTLIINAGLLLVSFLFSKFVMQEVRFMMFLTGFQALLNLAAAVVFYIDQKKRDNQLPIAFAIGFVLIAIVTVVLWKVVFVAPVNLPALEVSA